ncbi:MAG: hypothetical protein V7L23_30170 [Nostoc sp.]|uniref:hypothetical protein n=1 Tax=Nostoc sp. TaxID=1180 RepID=UPI002FEF6ABA
MLTFWRYQNQRDEAYALFQSLHQTALAEKDCDRAILLKAGHKAMQEKLFSGFIRAEFIINWLQVDSDLRQEQLTYPDIYEQCMNKLRKE